MFFVALVILFMFLIAYCHTPIRIYVGIVTEVSSWDGAAKLLTKTKLGKDTILLVHARHREQFVQGQIITVWTGGDLFSGIATTEPQQ